MANLSSHDKRVLAGGSAIVVMIFLWRAAPAVLSWRAEEMSRASAIAVKARETRAMIEAEEQLRLTLTEREHGHLAVGAALLEGTSEAGVASDLVRAVHEAADGAGFQISSVAVRSDSGSTDLRRVAADVRGSGAAGALAQFVASLEGDVPLIAIRSLAVSLVDVSTISGSEASVRVHLLLEALAPGEGSGKSSPGIRLRHVRPVQVYDRAAMFDAADSIGVRSPFSPFKLDADGTRLASAGSYLPALPSRTDPVLKGVVGGPPWQAIIGGVPGREAGAIVVAGDTVGGMKVRSVNRESAVLVAKDTVYSLTLKAAP